MSYGGYDFPTSEHAYQAAKCSEQEEFEKFLDPKLTAGQAKRLGRSVLTWNRWKDMKLRVMEDILRSKFEHGSEMARLLKETGDAILIEGNTWGDKFWGQCNGEGENYLGRILERIRSEL